MVAFVVVSLVGACSSTPERDELVDALVRSGLSEAEARCAADAVYDNLPEDQIASIAERGSGAARDTDADDDPVDIARREITACQVEHQVTTTTATTATTETTDTPETTETTAAGAGED